MATKRIKATHKVKKELSLIQSPNPLYLRAAEVIQVANPNCINNKVYIFLKYLTLE